MPPSPKSEWNHFGSASRRGFRRFVPLSCVPPSTTPLDGSTATPWNCVMTRFVFSVVHEAPWSLERHAPPSFPSYTDPSAPNAYAWSSVCRLPLVPSPCEIDDHVRPPSSLRQFE